VHYKQVGEGSVCDGRSRAPDRDRIIAQALPTSLPASDLTPSGLVIPGKIAGANGVEALVFVLTRGVAGLGTHFPKEQKVERSAPATVIQ
jgi:hypothetical protein